MIEYFLNNLEDKALMEMTSIRPNILAVDPLRAFENFEAFESSRHGKSASKPLRGSIWQQCLYDFVVHHGHSTDIQTQLNISDNKEKRDRLLRGKVIPKRRKKNSLNKEIDFYHYPSNTCIHAKTSARERWAVVDRAALFLEQRLRFSGNGFGIFDPSLPPLHFLVIYKEHPDDNRDEAIYEACNIEGSCAANDLRVITAQDPEMMRDLINRLLLSVRTRSVNKEECKISPTWIYSLELEDLHSRQNGPVLIR